MKRSAHFSPCRKYRYVLRRVWDLHKPIVMFVGLNPSTADEYADDATIRRCIGFAQTWGYGSLVMANLFAYRSTDPNVLSSVADPIGPRNDWWLSRLHREVNIAVVAWGIHGTLFDRQDDVLKILPAAHCLGLTKHGHPKHPLYLPASITPMPFAA
jgi:hypothetical protein